MKKRILSMLLALSLLMGVLPVGQLTLTASAEETIPAIPNLICKYNKALDMVVTFDKVEGATKYEISLEYYRNNSRQYFPTQHRYYISGDEADRSSFERIINSEVMRWPYDQASEKPSNLLAIRVVAENTYGDKLGESRVEFESFYNILDKVTNCEMSGTGVVTFEGVKGAASYTVSICTKNSASLKEVKIFDNVNTYADFSDVVRDGDEYYVSICAHPENLYNNVPSKEEFSVTYHSGKALEGTVSVDDDYTLIYGGFLKYISITNPTILSYQWKAYYGDAWHTVSESKKGDYPAYNLRVEVFAPGVYEGSVVSYDNRFTDPSEPYIVTDLTDLMDFIGTKKPAPGKDIYIKLGKDISGNTSRSIRGVNSNYTYYINIDLAGYTLSVENPNSGVKSNTKDLSLFDHSCNFVFRDSKRYDAEKKQTVTGKVKYKATGSYVRSSIFNGNVTIYGGEFYNLKSWAEHGNHVGYRGSKLKMYGGLIEADIPVVFYGKHNGEYGIFGGTLSTTRYEGVDLDGATYNTLPIITGCKIVNSTGNSEAKAILLEYDGGSGSSYTRSFSEAKELYKTAFYPFSSLYINGVAQSGVDSGLAEGGKVNSKDPDYYRSLYAEFTGTYEIKSVLNIDSLAFTVQTPTDKLKAENTVSGGESEYYTSALTWQHKVADQWVDMTFGDCFNAGEEYRADILITPKDGVELSVPNYGAVTVNGNKATRSGNNFRCSFVATTEIQRVDYSGSFTSGAALTKSGPLTVVTGDQIETVDFTYYRNGKRLSYGTKVTYGDYDCNVTLFAAENYVFTENTALKNTTTGEQIYPEYVEPDGSYASYCFATQHVDCVHTAASWQTSGTGHWQICTVCKAKFNEGEHLFNTTTSGKTIIYTCKDCGYQKTGTIPETRTKVGYISLDLGTAFVGDEIASRELKLNYGLPGIFDNSAYYYDFATVDSVTYSTTGAVLKNEKTTVTVVLKANSNFYFTDATTTSAGIQYTRESTKASTDGDTVTIVFTFTPYTPADVTVTLPEFTPGKTMAQIAEETSFTLNGGNITSYTATVKEIGGLTYYMTVKDGVCQKAEWSDYSIKPDTQYEFSASLDLNKYYGKSITVTNPTVGVVTDSYSGEIAAYVTVAYSTNANQIGVVKVNGAKEPVCGNEIAAGSLNADGNYLINTAYYDKTDSIFLCGQSYKLTVILDADENYTFAQKDYIQLATINGYKATVENVTEDGKTLTMSYTFTLPDHKYGAFQCNETDHWRMCENDACKAKVSYSPHNFVGNTCWTCGYTKTGKTVSGTVTSCGEETDEITVGLYRQGALAPDYTATVTGNSASYTLTGVAPGTYTLKASKAGHAANEYTVSVGSDDVVQDVSLFLCGDMDSSGIVDTDDAIYLLKAVFDSVNFPIAAGQNPDCDGDKSINTDDAIYLLKHVFDKENFPLAK